MQLNTCWERADLLAFVMSNCDFVTFPCGILGLVWYLIVLIPDLRLLSYFERKSADDKKSSKISLGLKSLKAFLVPFVFT